MILELPPEAERKALLEANKDRFPEPKEVTVFVDGGNTDKLTVVLGNPSKNSAAWDNAVASTFKPRQVNADNVALVSDCVLWPDAATWGGIVRRWPALPETLSTHVRRKLGGAMSMLEEPGDKEDLPEIVKSAQATNAAVVWRRLRMPSATIDVAVRPPEEMVWRMFQQQMAKDDVECWPLARDFAVASVAASSMPVTDLFGRWPGSALLVALTSSMLAGLAADVEAGEF